MIGEGGASSFRRRKQRISIARCILKDAPVVILDEATASVDADNERSHPGGDFRAGKREDASGDRPPVKYSSEPVRSW